MREQRLVFLVTETTLHCGVGQDPGAIDLPIQRDPVSRTPLIYGSSLKGGLREAVHALNAALAIELFGPRVDEANPQAELVRGKVAVGEARVLAYPVASAAALFAWVTSPFELNHLARAARRSMLDLPPLPEAPAPDAVLAPTQDLVLGAQRAVLHDAAFDLAVNQEVVVLAEWLAARIFSVAASAYWREALAARLGVVEDCAFRSMVDPAVVVTRVQLEEGTKVVKRGALLTEEVLPADTILVASAAGEPQDLNTLFETLPGVVVLGGDETLGRGLVALSQVQA